MILMPDLLSLFFIRAKHTLEAYKKANEFVNLLQFKNGLIAENRGIQKSKLIHHIRCIFHTVTYIFTYMDKIEIIIHEHKFWRLMDQISAIFPLDFNSNWRQQWERAIHMEVEITQNWNVNSSRGCCQMWQHRRWRWLLSR